jgi:hypothetical protein
MNEITCPFISSGKVSVILMLLSYLDI